MGTIWGIAMNVKNQRLLWDHICGYCNECKKLTSIIRSYMWYCNECIKSVAIKGPICDYYIYEMAL